MESDFSRDIYSYKTFRANSGAIRFRINVNLFSSPEYPEIYLIEDNCPHEKLFTITFDYHDTRTISIKLNDVTTESIQMPELLLSLKCTEMWVSWYKNNFRMGLNNGSFAGSQFLSVPLIESRPTVGFITFRCTVSINFDIQDTPFAVTDKFNKINGGELRWVKMSSGDKLPIDALIGGFETEPIYVARAIHNRSICPGKYVPSKQLAFVPWGFREHEKRNFEILCGYNLMWIKCRSPYLPDNVFKAGKSEVHDEPLYIGRAMIDNDLVLGKVHMLYNSCYLPYNGKEVCTNIFEVVAVGNSETCERNWKRKCFITNCKQPCP